MEFTTDVENCLEVLHKGGVILYPTDTIWGLGCDATNEDAVQKIYNIKNRPEEKSLIILLADERDVLRYVASLDLQVFDYLKEVKKPTTVIYEGAIGLAENLISSDGSVAIRVVNESFCKHLIKRFRKPLVSTSANLSGMPSAATFKDIPDGIKKAVDYTVAYRRDDTQPALPSSIIKWKGNGNFEVLRP
jgi:L-threonylcarbamoyladenylate synthase